MDKINFLQQYNLGSSFFLKYFISSFFLYEKKKKCNIKVSTSLQENLSLTEIHWRKSALLSGTGVVSNSSAERLLSQPVGLSLLFLGISIHLGSFPERVTKMFGKQSVRFGVCTYIGWKNSGSRVRSLSKTFFLLQGQIFQTLGWLKIFGWYLQIKQQSYYCTPLVSNCSMLPCHATPF